MKKFQFEFSVEETNLILEALGNLPFIKVHELISKIHQQASLQLADQSKPNEDIPSQPTIETVAPNQES
ncbi:MAG: hypothetical protein HC877_11790 [Thioploca sp.]|nr:hypothetical protein [Thioploca sp.]